MNKVILIAFICLFTLFTAIAVELGQFNEKDINLTNSLNDSQESKLTELGWLGTDYDLKCDDYLCEIRYFEPINRIEHFPLRCEDMIDVAKNGTLIEFERVCTEEERDIKADEFTAKLLTNKVRVEEKKASESLYNVNEGKVV